MQSSFSSRLYCLLIMEEHRVAADPVSIANVSIVYPTAPGVDKPSTCNWIPRSLRSLCRAMLDFYFIHKYHWTRFGLVVFRGIFQFPIWFWTKLGQSIYKQTIQVCFWQTIQFYDTLYCCNKAILNSIAFWDSNLTFGCNFFPYFDFFFLIFFVCHALFWNEEAD